MEVLSLQWWIKQKWKNSKKTLLIFRLRSVILEKRSDRPYYALWVQAWSASQIWLKPTCNQPSWQGRLIYFRLLLKSSIKRIHNLIHPVLEMAVDFWYYTKKCKKMSTVCQTTKTLTVENSENPWIKTFMKQIIWKGITFITVKSQIVSIFADKWRYYCDSFIFYRVQISYNLVNIMVNKFGIY